jgi:hypothetical protein
MVWYWGVWLRFVTEAALPAYLPDRRRRSDKGKAGGEDRTVVAFWAVTPDLLTPHAPAKGLCRSLSGAPAENKMPVPKTDKLGKSLALVTRNRGTEEVANDISLSLLLCRLLRSQVTMLEDEKEPLADTQLQCVYYCHILIPQFMRSDRLKEGKARVSFSFVSFFFFFFLFLSIPPSNISSQVAGVWWRCGVGGGVREQGGS